MRFNKSLPVFNIDEGRLLGGIKHDQTALSSPVVGRCNTPVPFLT